MDLYKIKKTAGQYSKEMLPAFLVFPFSIILSLYLSDHSLSGSWMVAYKIFLRFARFTFLLCLPLYVLSPIYKFILEKGKKSLLRLEQPKAIMVDPLKQWFFRPFQGIGIGFLFATKLVAVIQVITTPPCRFRSSFYSRSVPPWTTPLGHRDYSIYLPSFINPLDPGRHGDPLS
jgi:hypothetical protein